MNARWVAADVRAVAMSRRRIGSGAAAGIAACAGLDDALHQLSNSPYGRSLRSGQSLVEAQIAVASTLLWNVRVLAGWAPSAAVAMMRVVAGWFEIANVENLLAADFDQSSNSYRLGALSTSWRRLSSASTASQLRSLLAASWWGDPGGESPRTIGLAMRSRLVNSATTAIPGADVWAASAAALLIAREQILGNRELPGEAARSLTSVSGAKAAAASSLEQLVATLPVSTRWVFVGITNPDDLWRAEARWWSRVEQDGFKLLRHSPPGPQRLVGAIALLASDAWRTRAALQLAANGGGALEEIHAVA